MKNPDLRCFNPFTDRLSRDLRNDLSQSLLEALTTGSSAPLLRVDAKYRNLPGLGDGRGHYLTERLACYHVVLSNTTDTRANSDHIARLLWNHELFFEFHELLEKRWLAAEGNEKLILQALIRAAGVYILRQFDREAGAYKMAMRSREILIGIRETAPLGFSAEKLLAALSTSQGMPPKFDTTETTSCSCRHSH